MEIENLTRKQLVRYCQDNKIKKYSRKNCTFDFLVDMQRSWHSRFYNVFHKKCDEGFEKPTYCGTDNSVAKHL